MSDLLWDAARQATDEVLGPGTYAVMNEGNPDPRAQEQVRLSRREAEACDLSRHWRIWTCRCPSPGPVWTEKPRHLTCSYCGGLITEVTVYRGPWR